MAWSSFPGIRTSDIVFQTPGQCFFISISKHIRFILQSNADFRMWRKGSLKIKVLYLEVNEKSNNKKNFLQGHEGRSWEEFIWHISCSVMTRQLILWVSFFVHGSQKERKREVLVLVMVKWYLESSWASTSIWAALFLFLFFCYFYKYWGQEKSFSAFFLFHLFGNSMYWG